MSFEIEEYQHRTIHAGDIEKHSNNEQSMNLCNQLILARRLINHSVKDHG